MTLTKCACSVAAKSAAVNCTSVAAGCPCVACTHGENSEVEPAASVAVAVTNCPACTPPKIALNEALPAASVVTSAEPTKVCPSPLPLASQEGLAKSSTRNCVEAVLLSVPVAASVPEANRAG